MLILLWKRIYLRLFEVAYDYLFILARNFTTKKLEIHIKLGYHTYNILCILKADKYLDEMEKCVVFALSFGIDDQVIIVDNYCLRDANY